MTEITTEKMDHIVRKGEDQLILFYRKSHAPSTILMDTFQSVDALVGKDFSCYTVDVAEEPIIADAFGIKDVPEIIAMKNTKIFKRSTRLLYTNQILDLLK